eukprot:jgi/Undpi1/3208/HiC_scaffold_15.g06582.m1
MPITADALIVDEIDGDHVEYNSAWRERVSRLFAYTSKLPARPKSMGAPAVVEDVKGAVECDKGEAANMVPRLSASTMGAFGNLSCSTLGDGDGNPSRVF